MTSRFLLLLLYYFFFLSFAQAHSFDPFSFDHYLSLSPSPNNYELYWQTKPSYIRLGFVVNATGWFGFGLSFNGGMWGSDIMLVRTANGQVSVTDRKSREKNAVPDEDVKSFVDWQVVFAMYMHGTFQIEVLRIYDTKDVDDIPIVPGEMHVIWARNSINQLVHHEERGSTTITFLPLDNTTTTPISPPPPAQEETNHSSFIAQLSNFVISPDYTSARCANFVFPSDTDYHGVRFSPIIDNVQIVKSILAFACVAFPLFPNSSASSDSYVCDSPSLMGCDSLLYAWNIGGDDLVLPPDAGIVLGENGIKNIVLQVRYERTSFDLLTDSSGFEITYTPNLRPNNAGYIKLGSPETQIQIPSNKTNYAITNDCTIPSFVFLPPHLSPPPPLSPAPSASSSSPPPPTPSTPRQPQSIQVIANIFHAHAYGKSVWSAHYRNGQYHSDLGKNLYWDFLLEGTSFFQPPVTLFPQDRILTTCVYSTMGQAGVIVGGDDPEKEECLNFLLVYPLPVNFTSCINGQFSLRRDFDGVYPWDAVVVKSARAQEQEDYDRFRQRVVIMNQVMSAFSLAAATFMISCWFLFRDLRTFAFHLILMMAIADFWNCFGALFGLPNEGPVCEFQSWMMSYWSLASILWTSSIAFTLHMAFIKQREAFSPGNIESKRRPFHLFCWGVPLVLTILPALTRSFGQDYAFCWIVDEGLPHVVWRFIQFYVPLWIAFGYNAFVYVKVFRKLRQQDSPPALLLRLTLYPLILVICWFPDTLANLAEAFGFGGPWFNAFAAFFSASNGLLNALVYGLTEDVRTRLCCRGKLNTGMEQEPSVQREDI